MLIFRIKGGLGNQLFIWAAGLAFAHKTKQPVIFDTTTGFRSDPFQRTFQLPALGFDAPQLSPAAAFWQQLKFKLFTSKKYILEPVGEPAFGWSYYQSQSLRYRSWYMDGYWQNEAIIATVIEQLKEQLTPPSFSASVQKRLDNPTSVALHLRLGFNRDAHGKIAPNATDDAQLDEQYFLAAIKAVEAEQPTVHWVVFIDFPELLPLSIKKALGDFSYANDYALTDDVGQWQFLRHFDKLVLSNSSYSWWAARLSSGAKVWCPPSGKWAATVPSHWRQIQLP